MLGCVIRVVFYCLLTVILALTAGAVFYALATTVQNVLRGIAH
jgi:hypothetical protein